MHICFAEKGLDDKDIYCIAAASTWSLFDYNTLPWPIFQPHLTYSRSRFCSRQHQQEPTSNLHFCASPGISPSLPSQHCPRRTGKGGLQQLIQLNLIH